MVDYISILPDDFKNLYEIMIDAAMTGELQTAQIEDEV